MEVEYEGPKYWCTSETLKKTLDLYGVAVIPSVLSNAECKRIVDGSWDTLEYLTSEFGTKVPNPSGGFDPETTAGPLIRDDISTWKSFYELWPKHSMLIQNWQIGHAQYVWDLRQNPKILDIWVKFWGVSKPEDLLVSFDGISFHLPPETTGKGWYRGNTWLHTDQSYTRNSFECVQSWATGLDVNEGDGTLVIREGSHKLHGAFAKKFGKSSKEDWYLLEGDEHEFYSRCPLRAIKCPKGSLVFWDSRTIHSGQEPIKGRAKPNFRSVVYLCYTPRKLATESSIKKKCKYFLEKRMTSHWPHKIKVFGKKPYTYGKSIAKIKDLPDPIVGSIGKALAGFSEPDFDPEHASIYPVYATDSNGECIIIFL